VVSWRAVHPPLPTLGGVQTMANNKNYGIIRVEKIKKADGGSVDKLAKHCLRELKNNFDKKLTRLNEYDCETSVEGVKKALHDKWDNLTGKPRSDAVGSLSVVITTTEKALNPLSEKQFFEDCKKELATWYGEDNILMWTIHRDETTPHVHALIVPIEQKEMKVKRLSNKQIEMVKKGYIAHPSETKTVLNCRKITGGKEKLEKMQTTFFNNVFKKYNLDRGELTRKSPDKKTNLRPSVWKKQQRMEKENIVAVENMEDVFLKEMKTKYQYDLRPVKKIIPHKRFRESQRKYKNRIIPVIQGYEEKVVEIRNDNNSYRNKNLDLEEELLNEKKILSDTKKNYENKLKDLEIKKDEEKAKAILAARDKFQKQVNKILKENENKFSEKEKNYQDKILELKIKNKDLYDTGVEYFQRAEVAEKTLQNWRSFTSKDLREIAQEFDKENVKNENELQAKKARQKSRRSSGMSY